MYVLTYIKKSMTTNSPLDGSGRHQGEYIISNFRNTLVDSKPQDQGVCSLFFPFYHTETWQLRASVRMLNTKVVMH